MRFSPGCKCCGCVADANHVCLCNCRNPIPKTWYFSDGNGSHVLTGGAGGPGGIWGTTFLMTGVTLTACVLGNCSGTTTGDLLVTYRLLLDCATGLWTFRVEFLACPCTGGTARWATVAQGSSTFRSATFPFDCEDFSMLEFNVPTTAQSMPTPGGGGLITVVP